MENMILVFGSNEAGRHGKGAAKTALSHGAIRSVGFGLAGNTFALPTKDGNLNVLSLQTIELYITSFICFAMARPDLEFKVTRIGCGLAGYKDEEIAPLFSDAPDNCYFDVKWEYIFNDLNITKKYWGTYD